MLIKIARARYRGKFPPWVYRDLYFSIIDVEQDLSEMTDHGLSILLHTVLNVLQKFREIRYSALRSLSGDLNIYLQLLRARSAGVTASSEQLFRPI